MARSTRVLIAPQGWHTLDHELEGAFGRRAATERAKGVLMERHSVDDADAFEMLRDQSRRANSKLADVAAAVVDGHPGCCRSSLTPLTAHQPPCARAEKPAPGATAVADATPGEESDL